MVNGFAQLPMQLCIYNCTVRFLLFDKKDYLTSTIYAKNIFSIIFTIKCNILVQLSNSKIDISKSSVCHIDLAVIELTLKSVSGVKEVIVQPR